MVRMTSLEETCGSLKSHVKTLEAQIANCQAAVAMQVDTITDNVLDRLRSMDGVSPVKERPQHRAKEIVPGEIVEGYLTMMEPPVSSLGRARFFSEDAGKPDCETSTERTSNTTLPTRNIQVQLDHVLLEAPPRFEDEISKVSRLPADAEESRRKKAGASTKLDDIEHVDVVGPIPADTCTASMSTCSSTTKLDDTAEPSPRSPKRSSGPALHECAVPRPDEVVECGDLLMLMDGAPQEFRACPAVVTKVAPSHCTVTVLDSNRQNGIGECWPGLQDVIIENKKLRLGTRVVVDGMSGTKTKHLNGLTGVVSAHPREGHPVFIRKASCPDKPQLRVCVSFDDVAAAKNSSVIIEPRFLSPYDDMAVLATQSLSDAVEALSRGHYVS